MKSQKLAIGLLACGVLLVLLAVAWPYVLPKDLLWDDARAVDLTNASEELHSAMHAHDYEHDHDHFGETHDDDPPEVISAARKYREAQDDLDAAKFWTNAMPGYIRWAGLGICVAGLVAFAARRQ